MFFCVFVFICLLFNFDYAFADQTFCRTPICILDDLHPRTAYTVPLSEGQTLYKGLHDANPVPSGFLEYDFNKDSDAGGFALYPWDGFYASTNGVIQGEGFSKASFIDPNYVKAKKGSHILHFYNGQDNFWINSMAVIQDGAPSLHICYGHDSPFYKTSHYILTFDLYRVNPDNNRLEISSYKYDVRALIDTDSSTATIDFNDSSWVDSQQETLPESVDKTPGNLYQLIKDGGYIALSKVECAVEYEPVFFSSQTITLWKTEMQWKTIDGPDLPV